VRQEARRPKTLARALPGIPLIPISAGTRWQYSACGQPAALKSGKQLPGLHCLPQAMRLVPCSSRFCAG